MATVPQVMQSHELFKHCRTLLRLTPEEMAVDLCLADERTVRRMESGEITIYGPTWIAVLYLLEEADLDELADYVGDMIAGEREKLEDKLDEKAVRSLERRAQRMADRAKDTSLGIESDRI